MDFAKLMRDIVNMGGRSFDRTKSVIKVQEWLESCDEIFGDALKRRLTSYQLTGRAKS